MLENNQRDSRDRRLESSRSEEAGSGRACTYVGKGNISYSVRGDNASVSGKGVMFTRACARVSTAVEVVG